MNTCWKDESMYDSKKRHKDSVCLIEAWRMGIFKQGGNLEIGKKNSE